MLAAACSISRPPATVSVEILGDQRNHPTGQRFYPPGQPIHLDIPPAANTNGLYLLTPADLRYLLTP